MDDLKNSNVSDEIRMGKKGDRPYWILILSILIRAAHQVGAAVFLSSFLFGVPVELPGSYLILASVSGGMLLVAECMRHRQFFREVIGVSTIVKLILIGVAVHGGVEGKILIVISFVLASVCSHMPKKARHRLIF
jgi:hypothetical protein